MTNFNCWYWFLIFGILLGLILSWLLGRFFGERENHSNDLGPKFESHAVSHRRILYDLYKIKKALGLDDPCDDVLFDNLSSKKIAGIEVLGPEHLESILGIDTKTAHVLQKHGIKTLFDLARTSESSLLKMIKNANLNVDDTLVRSWSRQAQYCIENEWESLEKLRNELAEKNS